MSVSEDSQWQSTRASNAAKGRALVDASRDVEARAEARRKRIQSLNETNRQQNTILDRYSQPTALPEPSTQHNPNNSPSQYASMTKEQLIEILLQKNRRIENLQRSLTSANAREMIDTEMANTNNELFIEPAIAATSSSDSRQDRAATGISAPIPNISSPVEELNLPTWYEKLPVKAADRALVTPLENIKIFAVRLVKDAANSDNKPEELRDTIQEFFVRRVNKPALKRAKALESLIYVAKKKEIPWYIRSDARELFKRWSNEVLDGDLFWGMKDKAEARRGQSGSPSFDDTIDAENGLIEDKQPYKEYGSNGLENGQWWPAQSDTLRDGAHGAPVAGIAGISNRGAYSIVISSHSQYADPENGDFDKGEEVWYMGTRQTNDDRSKPSKDTQLMIDALKNKKVIRVIRSNRESKKARTTLYPPTTGCRYDGLYTVVGSRMIDPAFQHIRFHLKRVPGQDPIRFGGPQERPSQFEIRAKERVAALRR